MYFVEFGFNNDDNVLNQATIRHEHRNDLLSGAVLLTSVEEEIKSLAIDCFHDFRTFTSGEIF